MISSTDHWRVVVPDSMVFPIVFSEEKLQTQVAFSLSRQQRTKKNTTHPAFEGLNVFVLVR
jgi:hypothetical protein